MNLDTTLLVSSAKRYVPNSTRLLETTRLILPMKSTLDTSNEEESDGECLSPNSRSWSCRPVAAPSRHLERLRRLSCAMIVNHRGTLSDADYVPMYDELQDSHLTTFYPENIPWVLRNLTTKEFVRAEAIALKPEYIKGPFIQYFGFGHVILSRTSWSSSDSVGTRYEGGLHRGVWAGHCFDIVPLPTLVEAQEDDEWVDVSKVVAGEWGKIMEAENAP